MITNATIIATIGCDSAYRQSEQSRSSAFVKYRAMSFVRDCGLDIPVNKKRQRIR